MRLHLILQPFVASPTSQLILQPFRRFIYVTAHSTTVPLLHLRHRHFILHGSFSNPSDALPTSQLVLQPFCCFIYIIGTLPTSPGEPHMPLWWCLIYPWWFCNLQWLRSAGLHERCKLALELKRLKTPDVDYFLSENIFRRTMHSFSWVVKKADPSCMWMKREI